MCRKPYMVGILPFGCGQCLPCRINRRRVWTHRIMLESMKHGENCFVTLTYAPEHLPAGQSLVPRDTQLWLKRLRRNTVGTVIRYYLVGEYGTETQRPHYHAALFGFGNMYCVVCRHQYHRDRCDCAISRSWPLGNVYVGDLTPDSASYVAGYVTKKMTQKTDPRLGGRYPEFARMSLRPGIGAKAMEDVARTLTTDHGCQTIIDTGDVPAVLQHGKKLMPLGRYLKHRLREEVGLNEEMLKEANTARWSAQLSTALEPYSSGHNKSVKTLMVEATAQDAVKQEARYKLYKERRSL